MIQFSIKKHLLRFKLPAGTSRGILKTKPSWFFIIRDYQNPEKVGIGECSIIQGLSFDDKIGFTDQLQIVKNDFDEGFLKTSNRISKWEKWPAIHFGLETAVMDFNASGNRILFPGPFTKGESTIPINGLIWMGNKKNMFSQVRDKIENGWKCIKLKIGAINFDDELYLLRYIREQFSASEITIRVDANGAFTPANALEKLKILSELELHSIEQPIAPNQLEEMAFLCENSPLDIALDEELIGIFDPARKTSLLEIIKPDYIIIKPSLLGGIKRSEEWIHVAKKLNIGYWITSALETNIGLNVIAQWTAQLDSNLYQGLGTGSLYENNIDSPLEIQPGFLKFNPNGQWNYKYIFER